MTDKSSLSLGANRSWRKESYRGEQKKCVNFSKSLKYEMKQMVNCPVGLIGKKSALSIPKPHNLLGILIDWHKYW